VHDQHGQVKILIADDEPEVVRLVRIMLEWDGRYRVMSARNGEEALSCARADAPDLILLDGRMPRKSGLDVLSELQADPALSSIPVIMLSVEATRPDVQNALRQGAVAYLPKPFEFRQMVGLIERVLLADAARRSALRQEALEKLGKP
jgi:two-component system alkaline phosphatase synthesis response regulator PhoP